MKHIKRFMSRAAGKAGKAKAAGKLGKGVTEGTEAARRQEILDCMYRDAKKGNAAKRKAYITMSLLMASEEPKPPKETKEPKRPEGKKALVHAAARTAEHGTEWEGLLNS